MAFKFPTMAADMQLVEPVTGRVTKLFHRWWNDDLGDSVNETVAALEKQNATLTTQVENLTRFLRANSYTEDLTLTASAAGATAKVVISNHTRHYLDKSVSVTGAPLTGLAYNTTYYLYYLDEARDGTPDTGFQFTTDPASIPTNSSNPTRHLLGAVKTPATSADPAVTGGGSPPPTFPRNPTYLEP